MVKPLILVGQRLWGGCSQHHQLCSYLLVQFSGSCSSVRNKVWSRYFIILYAFHKDVWASFWPVCLSVCLSILLPVRLQEGNMNDRVLRPETTNFLRSYLDTGRQLTLWEERDEGIYVCCSFIKSVTLLLTHSWISSEVTLFGHIIIGAFQLCAKVGLMWNFLFQSFKLLLKPDEIFAETLSSSLHSSSCEKTTMTTPIIAAESKDFFFVPSINTSDGNNNLSLYSNRSHKADPEHSSFWSLMEHEDVSSMYFQTSFPGINCLEEIVPPPLRTAIDLDHCW